MARTTPNKVLLVIHSPLFLTLVYFAWLAVLLTVMAGMCASRLYRRSAPKAKSSGPSPVATPSLCRSGSSAAAAKSPDQDRGNIADAPPATLMPTNSREHGRTGDHLPVVVMSKTKSRRKLSANLNINMLREGLTRSRTVQKEGRVAAEEEDTIWKKTIIMGERCRTPTEEDDDMAVYDEKGNRRKIFHPKTPRSLPVSRTNSFAEINFRSSDLSSAFL